MTRGMRYGLASICVAAIGGIVALLMSAEVSATANGLYTLGAMVFTLAGLGGLVTVAVSLVRGYSPVSHDRPSRT